MASAITLNSTVSAGVRRRAADRGLSLHQVADASGIPFATLTVRLDDKRPFTVADVERLAAALRCSPVDLITGR